MTNDDSRPLSPSCRLAPVRSSPRPTLAGAGAALAMVASLGGGLWLARRDAHTAPCAMPTGLTVADLSPADRSWIAHRTIACMDVSAGRIDDAAYRARIAAIDSTHQSVTPTAAPVDAPMVWATRVVAVSSQWSDTSWSAAQVLGPPDVYPRLGDDAQAWASRGADDGPEWIEVALAEPTRLSTIDILETFNPGAVSVVEVETVNGAREVVYWGMAAGLTIATRRNIERDCRLEPIVAIRVQLDSPAVRGWNEIDAIGGRRCP